MFHVLKSASGAKAKASTATWTYNPSSAVEAGGQAMDIHLLRSEPLSDDEFSSLSRTPILKKVRERVAKSEAPTRYAQLRDMLARAEADRQVALIRISQLEADRRDLNRDVPPDFLEKIRDLDAQILAAKKEGEHIAVLAERTEAARHAAVGEVHPALIIATREVHAELCEALSRDLGTLLGKLPRDTLNEIAKRSAVLGSWFGVQSDLPTMASTLVAGATADGGV